MIYTYEYFLDALAKMHPEVEEKSLNVIIKRGLQGVLRVMRDSEELLLYGFQNEKKERDQWIKFCVIAPPEIQNSRAIKNYYKRLYRKEKLYARRQSSTK